MIKNKVINSCLSITIILTALGIIAIAGANNVSNSGKWRLIAIYGFMLAGASYLLYRRRNRIKGTLKRIAQGEADAVRAEYEAKQAKGDTSPQTSFILIHACFAQNDLIAAQRYGEETLQRLANMNAFRSNDTNTLWLCINASLNLHNVFNHQGQYIEAARVLRSYPRFEELDSSFSVQAAWSYCLGEHDQNARDMLDRIAPEDTGSLTPSVALQYAYLRHKLYGDDPRPIFRQYRSAIGDIDPRVHDTQNTLYSQYLRRITDDMRTMVSESLP